MPGAVSDEDLQKIREANDLVSYISETIPVRQKGKEFWCCCPLHHEKTPSFKIDPSTQLWHCFGCGQGGDIFGYVMKTEDMTFPEAIAKLAERAHITLETQKGGHGLSSNQKERLKQLCGEAASYFHLQLMRSTTSEAQAARAYLAQRNLGGNVPKTWNLGFAQGDGGLIRHLDGKGFKTSEMIEVNVAYKDDAGKVRERFFNRIMFPIYDVSGDCIAFGGRVVGKGEPKYLNSRETPLFHKSSVLFGLDKAKNGITSQGYVFVVEGYTDVIALHEAGVANAVATLGTALTVQHIRLLSRYANKSIVYLFDGDEAGQRAADRALGFIDQTITPEAGRNKLDLCAITLPDDLDPADYMSSHAVSDLQALVKDAKPLIQYGIERKLRNYALETSEDRLRALRDVLSILAPIKDSILAKDYAVKIAGMVHMREETVLKELSQVRVARQTSDAGVRGTQTQPAPVRANLSSGEKSRNNTEREFLSLVAQYPACASSYIGQLGQTQWSCALHESVAGLLLDAFTLDENPQPAALITQAAQNIPASAGILTSLSVSSEEEAVKRLKILSTTLLIGDLEQAIASMKDALRDANEDEKKTYFEMIASLQKQLVQYKNELLKYVYN